MRNRHYNVETLKSFNFLLSDLKIVCQMFQRAPLPIYRSKGGCTLWLALWIHMASQTDPHSFIICVKLCFPSSIICFLDFIHRAWILSWILFWSKWNHRMAWGERDLKDHLAPTLCHGQGCLPSDQTAQQPLPVATASTPLGVLGARTHSLHEHHFLKEELYFSRAPRHQEHVFFLKYHDGWMPHTVT